MTGQPYLGGSSTCKEWLEKRIEVFERYDYKCAKCGKKVPPGSKPSLVCHHIDGDPSNNKNDNLEPRCMGHHPRPGFLRGYDPIAYRIDKYLHEGYGLVLPPDLEVFRVEGTSEICYIFLIIEGGEPVGTFGFTYPEVGPTTEDWEIIKRVSEEIARRVALSSGRVEV